MTDPDDFTGNPVADFWDDLLADLAATATEYRDEGWETLELHPGDVTPLTGEFGDRVGLDVLIPDNEYEPLEAWFDEGFEVDGYEVYRSAVGGVVFLLVVVRDEDHQRAVLFPAFYGVSDADANELIETATETGRIHTYLRRLSGEFVEFAHDDPELFAPPEDVEMAPGADEPDLEELPGQGDDESE